jgi:hypothetical protein
MCPLVRRESISAMFEFTVPTPSALDSLQLLADLREQHGLALAAGRGTEAAELDAEIEASTHTFIGTAVTEIATLMAELEGPLVG